MSGDRTKVETTSKAIKLQNRRVQEHLQQAIDRMEEWTAQQARELRMTEPGRRAFKQAFRRIAWSRKYLILPRHTPIERRFLRMMLKLAIATDPALQQRATELAKYMSKAYSYEWTVSPITHIARAIARDVILREADTTFGEAPIAAKLAFVLFHHQQLGIENVSSYTELYNRTVTLDKKGYFRAAYNNWRLALGLQHHAELREQAHRQQ